MIGYIQRVVLIFTGINSMVAYEIITLIKTSVLGIPKNQSGHLTQKFRVHGVKL